MGQMNRISKTGLELIKGFEGLRRRSEPLPGGGWIVGYGHTRSAREGVEVTEREAEYLLRYDLQDVEQMVSGSIHAPLNQNEFDALVSFAWNVGRENFHASDVLKYINAGEMLAAAESFSAWRKARVDGRLIVVDALVRRRAAEKHLFLSHPSGSPRAPSQLVRPELDVAASVLALSDGALSIETKINDDGTVQKTVHEERESSAANTDSTTAEVLAVTALARESGDKTSELLSEAEIEREAQQFFSDEDSDDLDEDTRPQQASIWDATDEGALEDLDTYEADEDDDDDFDVDDSLLAAAITASSMARRAEITHQAEAEDEDDAEVHRKDETEAEATVLPVSTQAEATGLSDELVVQEAEDDLDDETVEMVEIGQAEVEAETASEAGASEETGVAQVVEVEDTPEDVDTKSVVTGEATSIDVVAADAAELTVADTSEDTEEEAVEVVSVDSIDDAEVISEETPEVIEAEHTLVETDETEANRAEAQSEEEIAEIWRQDPEADEDSVENDPFFADPPRTEQAQKRCIVDPAVAEHFPEYADEHGYSPTSGGRRSAGELIITLLPFILLVLLGAAMAGFGAFDYWSLVKSDTPVSEDQLYAGPFFTLIGGLGFVFGVYFVARKLMGVED